MGRVLLSNGGRSARLLALSVAASFASLSVHLLPFTSLWLEIHLIESLGPMSLASLAKLRMRYWPEVALDLVEALTITWLSMYSDILLSAVPRVIHISQSARMPPTASPSYVLCLDVGPRYTLSCHTGRAWPFLYSTAAAPIPPSNPEPSEYTLKLAVSLSSCSMDSSLVSWMLV